MPMPQPPDKDDIRVVNIFSVAAALKNLNLDIPVEEILKIINDEDEAIRTKGAAGGDELAKRKLTHRHLALSLTLDLLIVPVEILTIRGPRIISDVTTASEEVSNSPPESASADSSAVENARRQLAWPGLSPNRLNARATVRQGVLPDPPYVDRMPFEERLKRRRYARELGESLLRNGKLPDPYIITSRPAGQEKVAILSTI
jgi:hypothetical protein